MQKLLISILLMVCANVFAMTSITSCVYVDYDDVTQDEWKSGYGRDGLVIPNGVCMPPRDIQIKLSGHSLYTWDTSEIDWRGLRDYMNDKFFIASCWYSHSAFLIDVNVPSPLPKQLALYVLDCDRLGRSERIDIDDSDTGDLLDSRTVSGFANGVYLAWYIRGHVTIRVTNTGAANAVLSGLFFDS